MAPLATTSFPGPQVVEGNEAIDRSGPNDFPLGSFLIFLRRFRFAGRSKGPERILVKEGGRTVKIGRTIGIVELDEGMGQQIRGYGGMFHLIIPRYPTRKCGSSPLTQFRNGIAGRKAASLDCVSPRLRN